MTPRKEFTSKQKADARKKSGSQPNQYTQIHHSEGHAHNNTQKAIALPEGIHQSITPHSGKYKCQYCGFTNISEMGMKRHLTNNCGDSKHDYSPGSTKWS